MNYSFISADTTPLRQEVIEQLKENDLPVSDIDNDKHLFALIDEQQNLIGTAGLEFLGDCALVRSISIKSAFRGKGLGKCITSELEKVAYANGFTSLYLLTTTAKDFFKSEGYVIVGRDSTLPSLQKTSEFASTCPSTATIMKKELTRKKKILFVCIENSNRSQMSQAFAKILGGENIEAYSAGSNPSGIVNPKAIAAMKDLGYDLSKHDSKSLKEVEQYAPFDAVVTMGCGDACPWMPAKKFIDWLIPDPKHMEPAEFNKVRDSIRDKVKDLIDSL